MADVRFAVVARAGWAAYRVEHIYQHRADAEGCADARARHFGAETFVAEVVPPLAVARAADLWAVVDPRRSLLRTYAEPGAARAALAELGSVLAEAPLWQRMPVQVGVPQFRDAPP
jgi:hypothetical protein